MKPRIDMKLFRYPDPWLIFVSGMGIGGAVFGAAFSFLTYMSCF